MEWVANKLNLRSRVLDEITEGALDFEDMGDHAWVVRINNKGTSLMCYGIQQAEGTWYTKLIPEDVGPDVYDCPRRLLDMAVPRNIEWRRHIMQLSEAKK